MRQLWQNLATLDKIERNHIPGAPELTFDLTPHLTNATLEKKYGLDIGCCCQSIENKRCLGAKPRCKDFLRGSTYVLAACREALNGWGPEAKPWRRSREASRF